MANGSNHDDSISVSLSNQASKRRAEVTSRGSAGKVPKSVRGAKPFSFCLIFSCTAAVLYVIGLAHLTKSLLDIKPDIVVGLAMSNSNSLRNRNVHSLIRTLEGPIPEGDGSTHTVLPVIPSAQWPVTIHDEEKDAGFETIIHPGDDSISMSVPKFWCDPIHDNKLMTRSIAMQIGSCVSPDVMGNYARGESCPQDERTIFIGIASYRDYQCRETVESIFSRAKRPDRIRVGVVDQLVAGKDVACNTPISSCETYPNQALCQHLDRVDVYTMEAHLAVGPVFARHVAARLYRGEYYAVQSDAHVEFTQDWDVDIIAQHESTRNEMGVLSAYPSEIAGSIDDKTGRAKRRGRPIMCRSTFETTHQGTILIHGQQPESAPSIHGSPQLHPFWAAGFSFSRGHFVVNVPYDLYQPMIFQGEEVSIAVRGFTIGYDYYAPERSVCFHYYLPFNKSKREGVTHFWENADKYRGAGKEAMPRVLGIIGMSPETDPSTWNHSEEEKYGVGGARTSAKFYKPLGLDVEKKTAQKWMCERFVDNGKMHKEFTKYLRSDGMGIDYSKIEYESIW